MAGKISRITQQPFGTSGPTGDFGAFGSKAVNPSSPIFTQNPVTIQSLAPFSEGWGQAIIGNYEPALEDMNGLFLLTFYQIGYILQMGIAEYDSGTNYFTNSICQIAGQIYTSLVDNNLNNPPASSFTQWQSGMPGAEITGVMKPYAGTVAPSGYLICNGQAVSRSTYAALFNVCGTTYGAGNGTTTFNIPNLQGVIPVAYLSGDPYFGIVGATGGEETHTLTTNEMPSHSHTVVAGNEGSSFDQQIPTDGGNDTTRSTSAVGGGAAHNNLQPFQVVGCWIIKT